MPKEKNYKSGVQYGRAAVVPGSFDLENGTFEITFATETPVFRQGWDENYNEVLLCRPENVRKERMDVGLNLLNTHPGWDNRVKPEDVMGKITSYQFENNTIRGTVKLGAQCTNATKEDIESGVLNTFSVGYAIYRGVRVDMGKDQTPTYQMTDWEPNHVAIAPIPADVNSSSRSEDQSHTITISNIINRMHTIEEIRSQGTDEQKNRLESILKISRAAKLNDEKALELFNSEKTVEEIRTANPAQAEPVSVENVRAQATKEQKERLNSILLSTRSAGIEDSRAIELCNSDKSLSDIRQAIIEDFQKGDPKTRNTNTMNLGKEAIDKKREAAENALLFRSNPTVFKKEGAQATEFRGMTLLEIGKVFLSERGISFTGKSKDEVARLIMSSRDLSTSDFPLLLENVSNKMLRGEYVQSPEYWGQIAAMTSVDDFKAKSLYQIGSANGMKELPEGDEIKYAKLQEAKQTISVKSFGQGLLFTRQMMINDDLSAFDQIPRKFIRDWNLLRGDMVWGMITNNVKMDDGKTLFHADHGNLATTKGLVADTTLTAAILALKLQTDIDGKTKIRVTPKFLSVSPEYEMTARKILTLISPTNTGEVNVWSAMGLTLIVEPRLSGKAWYLSADPNAIDGLFYAYLSGQEGLRSNREDDFSTDSIKLAVRGEFGVAAIDHRGWYKNAGE